MIRFWRNLTKKDSAKYLCYTFFYLYLPVKFLAVFLWIPDPGFPDRIRILWPIRTQEKKKSDPDPEYVTQFFYLFLQFLAVFFMDPDSGSGISGSDTNFLANPDSGKKSDPDPDKRTRIRNTAFYFNRIRLT